MRQIATIYFNAAPLYGGGTPYMHGQLKRRLRGAVTPLRILRSSGGICRERRVKDKQGDHEETETGDASEVTQADNRRR